MTGDASSSEAEDDDGIDPDEMPEKSAEEVEKEAEEKKKVIRPTSHFRARSSSSE